MKSVESMCIPRHKETHIKCFSFRASKLATHNTHVSVSCIRSACTSAAMRRICLYLQQVRWSGANVVAEALQALCVPAPVKVQAGGEHLVVEREVDEEAALCQQCQHQPCTVTAVCSPVSNRCRSPAGSTTVGTTVALQRSHCTIFSHGVAVQYAACHHVDLFCVHVLPPILDSYMSVVLTCDHAGELVAQPSILVPHLHHHILAWHTLPMHAICLPRLEIIDHTLQSLHAPCTVRPSLHTSDSAAETRGRLCCRLTMQCAYSGVLAMHCAAKPSLPASLSAWETGMLSEQTLGHRMGG